MSYYGSRRDTNIHAAEFKSMARRCFPPSTDNCVLRLICVPAIGRKKSFPAAGGRLGVTIWDDTDPASAADAPAGAAGAALWRPDGRADSDRNGVTAASARPGAGDLEPCGADDSNSPESLSLNFLSVAAAGDSEPCCRRQGRSPATGSSPSLRTCR